MDKPTITVAGYFDDKQITKYAFVEEWLSHVEQLKRLSYDMEWLDKVDKIRHEVLLQAGKEFDAALKQQEK